MKAKQAVEALAALAHEYRLSVYRMLVEAGPQGLTAGTIATKLKIPPSSLTFHIQSLHRAGLVTQERRSRELIYAAEFGAMNNLVGYLTENCCAGSGTTCGPTEQCVPLGAVKRAKKPTRVA